MVGCACCLAEEQNRHRGSATCPGNCTVPANGGAPATIAKSDAKLRKATKCCVADHVTRFPHPDDPQLDFLTIVAVEAVREKRNLIVRENYWMCNYGTILKGMNSRKDLNSVISSSSS